MKLLNRLQLKDKLLLLGVLPAAALAIILAVYFTSTRLNDMYTLTDKTNENLAKSIAESSINGVFSGNMSALNSIIRKSINEPDILSIKISNKTGATLTQAMASNTTSTLVANPPKKIKRAIQLKLIGKTDEFDSLLVSENTSNNEIIGYVTLALSYESVQDRQHGILLNSFYITFLLLVGIGLIARSISLAIGRPILQLADDVKNITQSNYCASSIAPNYKNNDEISTLAQGIHEMAIDISGHQLELQQKINAATEELREQNDKLFSAQEKIIRSAEAKTKFISHISHEIRTPLNGIIGFLEIIQKTPLTNEQKKLINASYLSSKNLHVIINEVLDLAQLEAGKVIINKTNFQIKQTVQDALMLLSTQAEKNGVKLEYQHDQNAPDVINQDAVKFSQILMNLIGNAIKFSPNSTVTIKLTAHIPKTNHIQICIIDHGIGISDNDIKKLFNEFSQLNNLTATQGTGLGLAITKRILEALNGKISVTSKVGQGSIFCFSIPFGDVKDCGNNMAKAANIDFPFPDLSSKRILIADDNEINRMLLAHLLESQHAYVTCVNDGQQAINISQTDKFDLMLLDLRMPIKMGNEALEEIRRQANNPNNTTPAVAITAHITSGEERAHHISSFDGYLIKPIDQTRFFILIEQLLKEHDEKIEPFVGSEQNTSMPPSNKHFDYDIAQRSMSADPAFIYIMLNKFFTELPIQQQQISILLEEYKTIEAADIVHKTSGSAAYCGTPILRVICKQLESALRENDTQTIPGLSKELNIEINTLLSLKEPLLTSLKT